MVNVSSCFDTSCCSFSRMDKGPLIWHRVLVASKHLTHFCYGNITIHTNPFAMGWDKPLGNGRSVFGFRPTTSTTQPSEDFLERECPRIRLLCLTETRRRFSLNRNELPYWPWAHEGDNGWLYFKRHHTTCWKTMYATLATELPVRWSCLPSCSARAFFATRTRRITSTLQRWLWRANHCLRSHACPCMIENIWPTPLDSTDEDDMVYVFDW